MTTATLSIPTTHHTHSPRLAALAALSPVWAAARARMGVHLSVFSMIGEVVAYPITAAPYVTNALSEPFSAVGAQPPAAPAGLSDALNAIRGDGLSVGRLRELLRGVPDETPVVFGRRDDGPVMPVLAAALDLVAVRAASPATGMWMWGRTEARCTADVPVAAIVLT